MQAGERKGFASRVVLHLAVKALSELLLKDKQAEKVMEKKSKRLQAELGGFSFAERRASRGSWAKEQGGL